VYQRQKGGERSPPFFLLFFFSHTTSRHLHNINKRGEGGKWMRKLHQKFKRWTAGVLDLPQDVVLDMPRITMIGPLQMYVENHRGVLVFHTNELRLLLSNKGQLLIKGNNLVIRQILPEEVLLEGFIREVHYLDQIR
jgi:sporulation protein YqfC